MNLHQGTNLKAGRTEQNIGVGVGFSQSPREAKLQSKGIVKPRSQIHAPPLFETVQVQKIRLISFYVCLQAATDMDGLADSLRNDNGLSSDRANGMTDADSERYVHTISQGAQVGVFLSITVHTHTWTSKIAKDLVLWVFKQLYVARLAV
jgi:hypothetical protein